jgi:hypothetical protein
MTVDQVNLIGSKNGRPGSIMNRLEKHQLKKGLRIRRDVLVVFEMYE